MAETITADMIIHDIVTRHPETVKVFHGHGLPCTACAVGSRENVTGGARAHRFTPEKLDQLMKDLNAAIGLNAKSNLAFFYRAQVYEGLGRKDDAIADYRQALVIDPNDQDSKDALTRLGIKP